MTLDRKAMTAEFKPGIVVPLKPFFGSMGVAPAPELGRVSSNPPGRHAGNLDNRELVAGSTLYIPVFVPGALFEIGDGHAAQGDGEVDQTAIETSLRGRVQLTVRKDMKLTWPRAETATDYISMATDEDLKIGDDRGDPGDDRLPGGDEGADEARGLSAGQHRRPRRDHAAGGQTGARRPREDAEEHLPVTRHRFAQRAALNDSRVQELQHEIRNRSGEFLFSKDSLLTSGPPVKRS